MQAEKPRYRWVIQPETEPDLSWLEQWATPESYAGNEVLEDGRPVPFEDYVLTWGNPERHVTLQLFTERQCSQCGSWEVVDACGNIDYVDWLDHPEPGTYTSLDEIEDEHMRDLMRAGLEVA